MRARAVRSEPGAALAEASLEAVAAVHAARPNELALGKFALLGAARLMPLGREVMRTRQRGLLSSGLLPAERPGEERRLEAYRQRSCCPGRGLRWRRSRPSACRSSSRVPSVAPASAGLPLPRLQSAQSEGYA